MCSLMNNKPLKQLDPEAPSFSPSSPASAMTIQHDPSLSLSRKTLTTTDEFSVPFDRSKSNLFIAYLPLHIDDRMLHSMFKPFGNIISATIMRNIYTGDPLGTAFVRFESHESALTAMQYYYHMELGDRPLMVKWANKKHDHAIVGDARRTMRKLFVRNIPVDVTLDELKALMSCHGTVTHLELHADTAATNMRCSSWGSMSHADPINERNIAFVTFKEEGAATRALEAVHCTYPFASCNGIFLMAKLAEGNQQRCVRRTLSSYVDKSASSQPYTKGCKAVRDCKHFRDHYNRNGTNHVDLSHHAPVSKVDIKSRGPKGNREMDKTTSKQGIPSNGLSPTPENTSNNVLEKSCHSETFSQTGRPHVLTTFPGAVGRERENISEPHPYIAQVSYNNAEIIKKLDHVLRTRDDNSREVVWDEEDDASSGAPATENPTEHTLPNPNSNTRSDGNVTGPMPIDAGVVPEYLSYEIPKGDLYHSDGCADMNVLRQTQNNPTDESLPCYTKAALAAPRAPLDQPRARCPYRPPHCVPRDPRASRRTVNSAPYTTPSGGCTGPQTSSSLASMPASSPLSGMAALDEGAAYDPRQNGRAWGLRNWTAPQEGPGCLKGGGPWETTGGRVDRSCQCSPCPTKHP